jgi:rubrerythrin
MTEAARGWNPYACGVCGAGLLLREPVPDLVDCPACGQRSKPERLSWGDFPEKRVLAPQPEKPDWRAQPTIQFDLCLACGAALQDVGSSWSCPSCNWNHPKLEGGVGT